MTQPQNTRNSDFDGMIMVAFCVGTFVLFGVILWLRFHVSISTTHIYFRGLLTWPFYQIYVVLVKLTGGDIPMLRSVLSNVTELCAPTSSIKTLTTCTTDAQNVTFKQLSSASMFWNFIYGVISVGITYKGYLRISKHHPDINFNKNYSLDSFMDEQKQNYPHLRLFTDFNLQLISSTEGALMGMKTSREYAREHGLVIGSSYRELRYISNGLTKSKKDNMEMIPIVDRGKLILKLREQLGSLWCGLHTITNAEVILLARYLPTACSTDPMMSDDEFALIKKNALKIEDEYWRVATHDILNSPQFAPVGQLEDKTTVYALGDKDLSAFNIEYLKKTHIEPYLNHPVARKFLSKHAYTRSFIMAVILEARKLGVAAPCQMRWLKFYDRMMWAFLTNIGRPSFFCENMGAVSHYQAEAVAKQMIFQPHFDVAINGFEYRLQTFSYDDEALAILQNKCEDDEDDGVIVKGKSVLIEKTIFDEMPLAEKVFNPS